MDEHPDDELPWQPAKPEARCAHHPQRAALVRCPVCELDVCFSCFFPDLARCQRCVEEHPDEIAARIPLESASIGRIRGFFATVLGALSPRETAPGFAIGDELLRPFLFFVATFVPLSLLRGVIPYTHHVHFGSLGAIAITPNTAPNVLALDIARASGLSLVEMSAELVALSICFISLAGAFGRPEIRRISARAIAYRAFLLPLGGLLGLLPMLVAWVGPRGVASLETMLLVGTLPVIPFYLALHRTVRTVGRVDAGAGLAVATVPWALVLALALVTEGAMAPLMPAAPAPSDELVSAGR